MWPKDEKCGKESENLWYDTHVDTHIILLHEAQKSDHVKFIFTLFLTPSIQQHTCQPHKIRNRDHPPLSPRPSPQLWGSALPPALSRVQDAPGFLYNYFLNILLVLFCFSIRILRCCLVVSSTTCIAQNIIGFRRVKTNL